VVLEVMPDFIERDRFAVFVEESRVRVPHRAASAVSQTRTLASILAVQRVDILGHRNLIPLESRLAHIHRDRVGLLALVALEQASLGADGYTVSRWVLLKKQRADACAPQSNVSDAAQRYGRGFAGAQMSSTDAEEGGRQTACGVSTSANLRPICIDDTHHAHGVVGLLHDDELVAALECAGT
jgi:hypothetical protein